MKNLPWVLLLLVIGILSFLCITSIMPYPRVDYYSIRFLVFDPPSVLVMKLISQNDEWGHYDKVLWEGYYSYRFTDLTGVDELTFRAISDKPNFEFSIDPPSQWGLTIYTLDLDTHEVVMGVPLTRSIFLILLRVGIITCIEAIILWIKGFKQKRSWLILLGVTVISQLITNLFISPDARLDEIDPIVISLFGIYILALFNLIAIPLFLKKEQDKQEEVLLTTP